MPFGWIGRTAKDAASRGVPVFELLAAAGVAGGAQVSDDTALDAAEFHLMCNLLIDAVDDELHGAGRRRMVRGTGALGLQLMASARNLRAAIVSLARFHRMAGEFCELELVEHDAEAEIRIRSNLAPGPTSFVVEEVMANWLFVQFCFVLQRPIRLSAFHGSPMHPQAGGRHAYLDCPVIGAKVTALRLPKPYLDLAPCARILDTPTLDAVLYWLRQAAETSSLHVAHLDDRPLSASILRLLADRDLDFERCCEALAIAPRRVRSALAAEGGSFRQLRRVALADRFRPHLDLSANLDDAASALGYSDARSLRRGLKLATGLSVGDLRRLGSPEPLMGSPVVLANLRDRLTTMS